VLRQRSPCALITDDEPIDNRRDGAGEEHERESQVDGNSPWEGKAKHGNDDGHQHQKSEEKAEEPILTPETGQAHWGQRSADDQAPHRGHALWVRFEDAALTVRRWCMFSYLKRFDDCGPSKGRTNIIGRFDPN
jgi:hypothetical protein